VAKTALAGLRALRVQGEIVANRRIISGRDVNGLTVGACNEDSGPAAERARARTSVELRRGVSRPSRARTGLAICQFRRRRKASFKAGSA
jgi:hypothetical protein